MTFRPRQHGNLSTASANPALCFASRCRGLMDEVRHWRRLYERFRQMCRQHALDLSLGGPASARM